MLPPDELLHQHLRRTRTAMAAPIVLAFFAGLLLQPIGASAADPANKARSGPDLALKMIDLQGKKQLPLEQADKKAIVLFFILPDCPISNAYAPEINRIRSEYESKQMASFVVYVDPDFSDEEARKHAEEYGYKGSILCDRSHQLVKRTGVTIAPEVAVLGPDGKLFYRGRIDDLYADLGKRRANATQRDLRDALEAIVQGKPVPHETTKAIGCYISKR